jgi:subtilase family serine protease
MPMLTITSAVRRRLASLLALVLIFPLTLCACNVGEATISPSRTLGGTPGNGVCPNESASSGFGGLVYTPRQMRIAYGVESLCQQGYTGKGQTVILIESFGSPTIQADLDTYSKRFNLPLTTVDVRAPLSSTPTRGTGDANGWAVETTLDVETVHAIAPEAKIVVLTSPIAETEGVEGLPEFRKLQQYAVDNHLGNVVSQSYIASELSLDDAAGRDELRQWNDFYQKATTQQRMTFVAGSGDGGATDFANKEDARAGLLASVPTTGFPADSPWGLTVGGQTSSSLDPRSRRYRSPPGRRAAADSASSTPSPPTSDTCPPRRRASCRTAVASLMSRRAPTRAPASPSTITPTTMWSVGPARARRYGQR